MTRLASRRSMARTLGEAALIGVAIPLLAAALGIGIVRLGFVIGAWVAS